MINRRIFLASCAALPALAAKPRIDLSRVSVITDEIARTSQDAIAFAKQYGLKWVELRQMPNKKGEYAFMSEGELRPEAKMLDENGLRVSFLNTSLMKVMIPGIDPKAWTKMDGGKKASRLKTDAAKYERRMDDLDKALRAAKIFGVDKVRVFTGWRAEDPMKVMPKVAEIINQMAEVAAREKVYLLIENEGACNVSTCAEMVSLMKMVHSKWVGINWDPLNGTAYSEPPYPDGYNMLPKKRILNVQIKGKSILDGYNTKLDWKAIFDALVKDGYKGHVGLETHIFGEGQIQASHDSMKAILKIVNA